MVRRLISSRHNLSPGGRVAAGRKAPSMTTKSGQSSDTIEALLHERRRFVPPPEFAAQANAQPGIHEEAERDYLAFWKSWADKLEWIAPYGDVLEWNEPFAKWFAGGKLNASVNALDRHVTRAGKARASPLLRRRARRPAEITYARAAARGVPLRERSACARHQERRPRRDLHADDSGVAGRDARLRAHRRGALGDLRRLRARRDRRPRQRRGVRRDHHRRSGLAARQERCRSRTRCDEALAHTPRRRSST
jgi:hypothetical protein